MGPPIHLWTMRLESKHRVLTEIGRAKMNFIKLQKLLQHSISNGFAKDHQDHVNIKYREGNLVIQNGRVYEIINILSFESNVFLLCEHWNVLRMDEFYNSL